MKNPRKRLLHERSHLMFEFPQTNGRQLRAYLPMLENAQVSESQKSNLASYNILGRNSNLFAYTGSESRSINVSFKISLLHLLDTLIKEGIDDKFKYHFTMFFSDKEAARNSFFIGNVELDRKTGEIAHARIHRSYYQKIAMLATTGPDIFSSLAGDVISFLGVEDPDTTKYSNYSFNDTAIDLAIFWINLVRSSTKNNSKNTTLGPPIVRLTHGPMYNNVPCVVESYNIRLLDESGFEVQTLMPKQIEISLTMKEVRGVNSQNFKVFDDFDGDNNAGWEYVIAENNMDPYNGNI